MNGQKRKKEKAHPVNYVLLAVSLIIFGTFGIIFITQMEMQPGWIWEELNGENSMDLRIVEGDDINDDDIQDIVAFPEVNRRETQDGEFLPNDNPQFGSVYALDALTGNKIWEKEVNNPIKRVFNVGDIDGDGKDDYFASIASAGPDWIPHPFNPDEYIPEIFPDMYSNILINGINGEDIPILTGDNRSFTNFFIQDLVSIGDFSDNYPDLIAVECELKPNATNEYNYNLSTYFINGSKYSTVNIGFTWIGARDIIPCLDYFQYGTEEDILFINDNSIVLLNSSTSDFLGIIYNETISPGTKDYSIIEDLNGDGFSEIMVINYNGNVSIISGSNGFLIRNFEITGYNEFEMTLMGSNPNDQEALILFNIGNYVMDEYLTQIITITETTNTIIFQYHELEPDEPTEFMVLGEDLDGDLIDEIVRSQRIPTAMGTSAVDRITIMSIITEAVFGIINNEYSVHELYSTPDINDDGKRDFAFPSGDRILLLASTKPTGLWLSPETPWGFPLFIALVVALVAGIIILAIKGRKVNYTRKGLKEHKLTVTVNAFAIALISLTFIFFLIQLNIFNRTLIFGENMANITIYFLMVIITWYGILPLTAAIYNRFSSNFAILFIKLRTLFFKISRAYNTDIFVLDMKDRKEIGTIIQLKRIVLPLMLSIATGFYSYGFLSSILGYPTHFLVFGSTEFFQFMNGYMLLCIFPMILSFIVFSFFISGNFLLDDAGIVYFRQSKKYRQPADIEPISIWAQSIIKGIAGLSAIITLIDFLTTVDFSGFFADPSTFNIIFGVLIIIVFFAGIPFLTAFSYILLAGEVMEFSMDFNIQKLYRKMEKDGYDTTPLDITNIFPSGRIPLKNSEKDI